ncbi:MAG TPA: flagellar FlbD family protein [Papillibacter sp.]|jgi:flagellar protein FlbD|nr:flagellar FlbD family protein [Papillibacter sp.]
MIELSRINKINRFWVNEDQIELVEQTPDTIVTMVSGRKYAVAETPEEIAEKIVAFRRRVAQSPLDGRLKKMD